MKMKMELLGVEVELKKEALWKVPLLMVLVGGSVYGWWLLIRSLLVLFE